MVDVELRERLGQNGRDVVNRFGWETMVDQYEYVLRQAASAGRAP